MAMKFKVIAERVYPFTLGLAAGVFAWTLRKSLPSIQHFPEFLAAIISVFSIAMGFLLTVQTVLYSSGGKTVKILKQRGFFARIVHFLIEAVLLSFLSAAASTVMLLTADTPGAFFLAGLIGLLVWTTLACLRISALFFQLLLDDATPPG